MTAQGHAAHQTVRTRWDRDLVPGPDGETNRPEPDCPVEIALEAIGGRWTTLVVRDLLHGPRSFGDLAEGLPTLSAKVLADRLAELRGQGLVERLRYNEFPARTRYRLTPAGEALRPLLVELYRTGEAVRAARTATAPASHTPGTRSRDCPAD